MGVHSTWRRVVDIGKPRRVLDVELDERDTPRRVETEPERRREPAREREAVPEKVGEAVLMMEPPPVSSMCGMAA